jgi:hypothetical protein
VPLLVIRIALNHIGILISDGKIKITEEMQIKAKQKIQNIRSEVVFDYVKNL